MTQTLLFPGVDNMHKKKATNVRLDPEFKARIVRKLKATHNPDAVWSAFREELIDEMTVYSLLPLNARSFAQRFWQAVIAVFQMSVR